MGSLGAGFAQILLAWTRLKASGAFWNLQAGARDGPGVQLGPGPGQFLLQESRAPVTRKEREAAAAGRSGGTRRGLLWFTTLVLYAAFVGLVRAQAVPSQAGPGGSH